MIRSHLSPSVSLIAFAATLASVGCSESPGEEALDLGSTSQALHSGEDQGHEHARGQERGHGPGRLQHHRPGRCEPPPEPAADPVVFTPATAAARSGRRAAAAVDYGPLINEPIYAQLLAEQVG